MKQEGMTEEGFTIQWLCQELYPHIAQAGVRIIKRADQVAASVPNHLLTREKRLDLRNTVIDQFVDDVVEGFVSLEEDEQQTIRQFMWAVIADEIEKHEPT